MDGVNWKGMIGKTVFLKIKNGYNYNGIVSEVIDSGDGFIWIHLRDKFGKLVVLLTSEIVELVEK